MKQTIDLQHRDFFLTHQYIEFEDLLSPAQIQVLLEAIHKTHGYDLWRSHPEVKKITMHSHVPQIACDLTQSRSIRMGYDQTLPLEQEKFALQDKSCIRGLQCGLLLCLQDHSHPTEDSDPENVDIFPWKAGHGTFFSPEQEFDFAKFSQHLDQNYFIVLYTHPVSLYAVDDQDAYTSKMKKMGYVSGDRLLDKQHPLIYKRG